MNVADRDWRCFEMDLGYAAGATRHAMQKVIVGSLVGPDWLRGSERTAQSAGHGQSSRVVPVGWRTPHLIAIPFAPLLVLLFPTELAS